MLCLVYYTARAIVRSYSGRGRGNGRNINRRGGGNGDNENNNPDDYFTWLGEQEPECGTSKVLERLGLLEKRR